LRALNKQNGWRREWESESYVTSRQRIYRNCETTQLNESVTFQGVSERDGPFFAVADAFQSAFGKIQVLDILQVLEDGFAHVEGLGAPGAPRELF
jgi:hypothetical protein